MARPPATRPGRSDLALAAVALVAAAVFFASLDRLWPLARTDLHVPPAVLEERARDFLLEAGFPVANHEAASALKVDARVLDYLQRTFGRTEAQRLIAAGYPVYWYEVLFKRRGDPDRYWVHLGGSGAPGASEAGDPAGEAGRVLGWGRSVQEDAPAGAVEEGEARDLALETLGRHLGVVLDPAAPPEEVGGAEGGWREQGFYDQLRPERRDRYFVYQRHLSREPELRQRLVVIVSGDRVTGVDQSLVVPEAARRAARARKAPMVALQTVGILLAAAAVIGAFAVFLTRLRAGTARLAPAARWIAVIGLCFLATQALRGHELLAAWDPLWPRWIAALQTLALAAAPAAWILLVLFVVIAAGDALDREEAREEPRGASLWALARGRIASPAVGLASLRGFLVGLVCGGVLAGSILVLQALVGAWPPIQPQGFFFFALNSRAPLLATLLYFFMVALAEELAYRYFGGTFLLRATGRRWLAVLVPAALYGLTHTGLEFLPPAEPFWGRAVVMTLVGCVWGWAYFRYDALTVVLSHFTADLFIFNWPRLGSGDPLLAAKAAAVIAVPLLPALLWGAGRSFRRERSGPPGRGPLV
ncbi:MAG: type II CAAX prenyl endopeptidase Rce1 family protein [Thermoanaerobaculia bacterium]